MPIDRRGFLANGGGLLALAALSKIAHADQVPLPPLSAPSEKPAVEEPPGDAAENRVGIAVVGIGHLVLEQILPGFATSKHTKLVALVSGHREKALAVAHQTGVDPKRIYDYASFDRIKDDPAIDAVYIVLPNMLHAEYTVRAAAAGKHVLCEKPMATTSADAQQMVDACKRAGKRLMIGYRMQYEPHQRYAMRHARDKAFGKIKLVEGHNGQNMGDPNQWRLKKAAGGGSLMDVGIYCLNTTRFVLGEEPTWVQGSIHSTPGDPRFKEVDELAMFQLGFPSGALGTFSSSFGSHRSQRYRVVGDNGRWIDLDPAYAYDGLELAMNEVTGKDEQRAKIALPQKQQFALELDHFAQCVRTGQQPFTPGEEGVQDMKLIEAILQSAREGRRIELPRIAKLDAFRGTPPADA
jgi:predicted dehydrogenase